jgi:hypothetical protein
VHPILPPRSWDKAHALAWNRIPRELQTYIQKRAAEDSKAVRQAQNQRKVKHEKPIVENGNADSVAA